MLRLFLPRAFGRYFLFLTFVLPLTEGCLRPERPLIEAIGGSPGGGQTAAISGGSSTGGKAPAGQAGSPESDDSSGLGAASSGGQDRGPIEPPRIAGTKAYDCSLSSGDEPTLSLEPLITDLEYPVFVTHPPDDDSLFVLELTGSILKVSAEGQRETFLELGDKVHVGGDGGDERGLLSMAFHPKFAENGLFYVHYSAGEAFASELDEGDTVIEEYHVQADGAVELSSGRIVLSVPQPDQNHKGGTIAFGLDDLLYIGLGDGGGSEDQYGNGQNDQTLLAAILRIDPLETPDAAYAIPPGNLNQAKPGARGEIWDMGLRNPFRFNFDACTGDLYVGDVGQDEQEEINVELALDGQKNYGWSTTEGDACFRSDACDSEGLTPPTLQYTHEGAGAAVTGGAVYRGGAIPALRGSYFYADFVLNRVWSTRFDRDSAVVSSPVSRTQDLNATTIVAIQNDNRGELLFVSLEAGTIYKLVALQ